MKVLFGNKMQKSHSEQIGTIVTFDYEAAHFANTSHTSSVPIKK